MTIVVQVSQQDIDGSIRSSEEGCAVWRAFVRASGAHPDDVVVAHDAILWNESTFELPEEARAWLLSYDLNETSDPITFTVGDRVTPA